MESARIFPSQVQGDTAPQTIAEALKKADSDGCDVIILTRGGGSYEDLMAFNAEEVARAVAGCVTPIISAVGHETDTTLADYAADVRAPTPSAAAEICAPELEQLLGAIDLTQRRLADSFGRYLGAKEARLAYLGNKLGEHSPLGRLAREEEHTAALAARINAAVRADISRRENSLDTLSLRLGKAFEKLADRKRGEFERLLGKLEALDPYRVLERGYTITMKDGLPVTSAGALGIGDEITIRFRDRTVTATVTGSDGGKG